MEPTQLGNVEPPKDLSSVEDGPCADPYCTKSGRYRVTCYVCERVFHTGCASIPDLDYKTFRCPDCFGKRPRREDCGSKSKRIKFRVECDTCQRVFYYFDVKSVELDTFQCTRCYRRTSDEDSLPESSAAASAEDEKPVSCGNYIRRRNRCKVSCGVCRKVFYFENIRSLDFEKYVCLECYLFGRTPPQTSTPAEDEEAVVYGSYTRRRNRCKVSCEACRKVFYFENIRSLDFRNYVCLECYLFERRPPLSSDPEEQPNPRVQSNQS